MNIPNQPSRRLSASSSEKSNHKGGCLSGLSSAEPTDLLGKREKEGGYLAPLHPIPQEVVSALRARQCSKLEGANNEQNAEHDGVDAKQPEHCYDPGAGVNNEQNSKDDGQ